MPLIWTNAAVRDAHMTAENRRYHEERHQEPVQAPADQPGADVLTEALEGIQGQPGSPASLMPDQADTQTPRTPGPGMPSVESIAERALNDVLGDGLDETREFQEARRRTSRVRAGASGRSSSSTQARSTESAKENRPPAPHYPSPLADPVLEKLANDLVDLDAKECWEPLLARLKAFLPAHEAIQARVRVWDRRRDLVRQKKKAAKLAARLKAMEAG